MYNRKDESKNACLHKSAKKTKKKKTIIFFRVTFLLDWIISPLFLIGAHKI